MCKFCDMSNHISHLIVGDAYGHPTYLEYKWFDGALYSTMVGITKEGLIVPASKPSPISNCPMCLSTIKGPDK